ISEPSACLFGRKDRTPQSGKSSF
ncbi:DNA polymerase III subunits gamma and tau, partial [Porphyromonas gingivalis]